MDYMVHPILKYVPSVLLGVFIGISLTVFVTFEERFPPEPYRKLSPRFRIEVVRSVESAPPGIIESENIALQTLNKTDKELRDIRNFVTNINNGVSITENTPTQLNGSFVNATVADQLSKNVRILCWILTYPETHMTKAIHVKNTWARRCNKLLIISSQKDETLNSIGLNVTDDRLTLWGKTRKALQYIHEHHLDDADWFFKADDDTYTSLENMRHFLNAYSPSDPIYFGYKLKALVRQGYMSGGAGYVMSKTALIRFINDALPYPEKCEKSEMGAEDVEVGKCLENVKVYAGDTRDSFGRGRFFIHNPEYHLRQSSLDPTYWYWKNMFYDSDEGLDCCSDSAISWHYVLPQSMYFLDYFLYTLRAYGRVIYPQHLPKKVNFTAVAFELEREMPDRIYTYYD